MDDAKELGAQANLDGADLEELTARVREVFDVRDRRYGFPPRKYKKCFVGSEAVAQMIAADIATDEHDALAIGNMLLQAGVFRHVLNEHAFKNEYLFYRFASDADHGEVGKYPDGSSVSWADFLTPFTDEADDFTYQALIPFPDEDFGNYEQVNLEETGVSPLDEHNARLLDAVRPKEWKNPAPKNKYNLVVVGAGAGGLVSAAGAAGVGARVALIESHLLGGDCLNVGCVPSKALLKSARVAALARNAGRYGVKVGSVEVDFPAVMERMRELRAGIGPHDSAQRFSQELGIDVFLGRGTFTGRNTIEVGGNTLAFSKAVVATGGSAAIPPIEGLAEAPYLTNATVFNLTELPERLGVIGVGPIGMELAQAFQRFGARVTAFSRDHKILPREDPDAAAIVQRAAEADGVQFEFGVTYKRVESKGDTGPIGIVFETNGAEKRIEVDALLVATGRKPNVSHMGLEDAGVEFDPRMGIRVNERLQTTNPSIYAVGDVATKYQFTHMADFMARMVIRNALFFGRDKFSRLLIPWATYTDPEIAHVGLYERDLEERGIEWLTLTRELAEVDRSQLDGDTEGFVKIHVQKGTDKILGATIVGPHAGDLISEISVAIHAEMGLGSLANVIHPYPTVAEAMRQCGDAYNRTRLTPTVQKIFNRLMTLQRL